MIPQGEKSKQLLKEKYGAKGIYPLDHVLGVAGLPFKISPRAMIEIAYWAQNQSSFQRAEDVIMRQMKIKVNDDTVRKVANYVGDIVFQNDLRRGAEAYAKLNTAKLEFSNDRKGIIYILTDGAAVNTRQKDADGSTWRENKLGEVFTTDGIYTWIDKHGKKQRQIRQKEYVSYIGPAEEFKKQLLDCALRAGYGLYKETVFLSDGATWIRNMIGEVFPDAQQILDYFHLCENVNSFARFMFQQNESKYKPWAEDICALLKESKSDEVFEKLEPFKSKITKDCPVNLPVYIRNNQKNIDYVEYERKGYFIGSGAIESGNKVVLQDRLKRAGMRWNTPTAQSILTLKAKYESGLWVKDVELPFLEHCRGLST